MLFFILAHHHIVHPQVKEHRDHVIKIIEDYLKGTYDEINMTHFITLDLYVKSCSLEGSCGHGWIYNYIYAISAYHH